MIESDDPDENPYDFKIQGTGAKPDIQVEGNGNMIADEDDTPSLDDHTDFGSANTEGGTVVRTFTIRNTGPVNLNLTGDPKVSISGTHAGDFTVTQQPSTPIAASGTTIFKVTFDPSGTGTRMSTINIASDDPDENPYNFSIQGNGIKAGNLDPSFDSDGKVMTDFNGNNDSGNSIAIQSDGKIVVGGYPGYANFALARYNSNGTLDTSFNGSGKVISSFPFTPCAYSIALQTVVANHYISMAGEGYDSTYGIYVFCLAR